MGAGTSPRARRAVVIRTALACHWEARVAVWRSHCRAGIGDIQPIPYFTKTFAYSLWHVVEVGCWHITSGNWQRALHTNAGGRKEREPPRVKGDGQGEGGGGQPRRYGAVEYAHRPTRGAYPYYGSGPLNNPWQLQGSFDFARYCCSSPYFEANTNIEKIYKNAQ